MLAEYNRLVGLAMSINDVNRIHIAFANTVTPAEVLALHETLFVPGQHDVPSLRSGCRFGEQELRHAAREWVDELVRDLRRVGKDESEDFARTDIRESVTLFSDGGDKSHKTLILVLPGSNQRLMMPTPTFLQNLSAETHDVLIIRDGTRTDYTRGLDGLAQSVSDLGAGIRTLVDFDSYARVVGLGISAGGLPMVLVATQLGIDVVACGAGSPFDGRWAEINYRPDEALKDAVRAGYTGRVVLAYGAQYDRDRESAEEIGASVPAEKVQIAIPGMEVKHNILHPMSYRKLLPKFFAENLGLRRA